MKSRKFIGLFLSILMFLFTTPAMAHSKLVQTIPNNGEKVIEAQEIKMIFTENILPISTFQLKNEQNEPIPVNQINVKGKELSGTPVSPLPQNHYSVEWKAAAEDGHISEGTFSFEVQAANANANDKNKQIDNHSNVPAVHETTKANPQTSHSSTWIAFLAVAMVILMGAVIWFGFRGKGRK